MINLDNIKKNTSLIVEKQINDGIVALKTIVPGIIGTVILDGIKRLAKNKSCEVVQATLVDVLNYSTMICLVGACFAYIKGMDQYYASINPTRIKYIKIPEIEFQKMQDEIFKLRRELENLNTKQLLS